MQVDELSFQVSPMDEHNKKLVSNVHPPDWKNPEPTGTYNLVVIGAGTAGLVSAAGAASLGAKTALIERSLMGGDCLNAGCVPSKSIIRSGHAFADVRDAWKYGVRVPEGAKVDFAKVMERMREIRARISHHDSVEAIEKYGTQIFLGEAHFSSPDTITVGGKTLKFKKAVIATGARAVTPKILGLADVGCLTNETLFNLTELPPRLAVIGGGPIGCEMAQSFARFGAKVTLFHSGPHLLGREDPDAAKIIQQKFEEESIEFILNSKLVRVEKKGEEKILFYDVNGKEEFVSVDEILASAGRAPNVQGLNLDKVGVEFDERKGVKVNDYLQTTNPRIYAAGDICLNYKFTHTAEDAAKIVIENALFFGKKKFSDLVVPWATYTDPEVAHVGFDEAEAKARGYETEVSFHPMSDVDRALAEGEEEGFVKIISKKGSDQILGAIIVARHAGEMISEVTAAMVGKMGLNKLASVIHPYPTQADAIKRAAEVQTLIIKKLPGWVKNLLKSWFSITR